MRSQGLKKGENTSTERQQPIDAGEGRGTFSTALWTPGFQDFGSAEPGDAGVSCFKVSVYGNVLQQQQETCARRYVNRYVGGI